MNPVAAEQIAHDRAPERRARHRSARTALVLLALASLAGVAMAPLTRPTVRAQARYAVPFMPRAFYVDNRTGGLTTVQRQAALRRVAGQNPSDGAMRVAYALYTDERPPVQALRPLVKRFPNDPTIHAAFVLRAMQDSKNMPVPPAEVLRACTRGAVLEPDNAFFPAMRAVALHAAGDRAGMLAAFRKVRNCTRWEDHTDTVMDAVWRLHSATGRFLAIDRFQMEGMNPMFPFTGLRKAAQDARDAAAAAERAGNADEGIGIRKAVMHLGGLMRADSHSALGSTVGISIVRIAAEGLASGRPQYPEGADREATYRTQEKRFLGYLERHEHTGEIEWVRREFAAASTARGILMQGTDRVDWMALLFRWMAQWSMNIGLLGGALWILVLGGACAVVAARVATVRDGRPLARGTRRGIVVGTFMSFLSVPMWVDDKRAAFTIVLLLAVITLLLGRRRAGLRSFGGTLLFLLIPVAVFAAWWRITLQADGSGTAAIMELNPAYLALVGHPVLGLIVPILLALWLAVAALAWRVPVSVGVVRGMARAAVPAGVALACLYAGSVVVTARTDAHMSYVLARQAHDEGRYYAEVLGRQWPE